MSDKWQQINLKLEAPLAQALRDMKHGHDEPLSEVILRLLWKAVRQQNSLGARGAPAGRSRAKGGERGALRAGRGGQAPAPKGRAAGAAGKGRKPFVPREAPAAGAAGGKGRKPFVPREAPAAGEWGADGGQLEAAGTSARPRAPRKFGEKPGKPFRPQRRAVPLEGAAEAPKRAFRPRNEAPRAFRPRNESDTTEGRPQRPRKAKGARPRS